MAHKPSSLIMHAQQVRAFILWALTLVFTQLLSVNWVRQHRQVMRTARHRHRRKLLRLQTTRRKHISRFLNTFNTVSAPHQRCVSQTSSVGVLILRRPVQASLKSLFHFRLINNLNEFYLYDFYNFYSASFNHLRDTRSVRPRQSLHAD